MEFPVSLWSEEVTKLIKARPEVADEWVLLHRGWHQYAAGICGITHWSAIVFRSFDRDTMVAEGFKRKGDYKRELERDYIKSLKQYIAGSKDGTYGHVGRQVCTIKCMKLRDILKTSPQCGEGHEWRIDLGNFDPYHQYGTARAVDGRKHKCVAPVAPAAPTI